MLPEGMHGIIRTESYEIPPIFKMLKKDGNIDDHVMYNTYNMGIGMVIAVSPEQADKAVDIISGIGDKAYIIGEICEGSRGITLC